MLAPQSMSAKFPRDINFQNFQNMFDKICTMENQVSTEERQISFLLELIFTKSTFFAVFVFNIDIWIFTDRITL